jgi:predicted HTH transcriptional regulator
MEKYKSWIETVKKFLQSSLSPIPHELNELDWKEALSENNERMAQHLSAFANQAGGGFFCFGIGSLGQPQGVTRDQVHDAIQKLANLARTAIEPPLKIDHHVDVMGEKEVLFIYVPESLQKPVHLRGKGIEYSYIRSGGQTRKMGKPEIANAVLSARQFRYEELEALPCKETDVLKLLDAEKFFRLLNIPAEISQEAALERLVNEKMVYRHVGNFSITNLGALAAARNLNEFPGKERFPVRVVKYRGVSRIEAETEREFLQGYGAGFQEVIHYVLSQLPVSEVIKDALRRNVPLYPEITIRELVANAMIHRDFSLTGTNPMIEIFSDRLEITSPGALLPSVTVERLIDATPESRNELFAALMRRLGICEERGSGIDKALSAVEIFGLPPVKFMNGPHAFKAVLYGPKSFKQMSQEERLDACLQHCCIRYYVANDPMTNASFRKRLGLRDGQYTLAWKVLDAAMEKKWIKPRDLRSKSRKYASYIPYWA